MCMACMNLKYSFMNLRFYLEIIQRRAVNRASDSGPVGEVLDFKLTEKGTQVVLML